MSTGMAFLAIIAFVGIACGAWLMGYSSGQADGETQGYKEGYDDGINGRPAKRTQTTDYNLG